MYPSLQRWLSIVVWFIRYPRRSLRSSHHMEGCVSLIYVIDSESPLLPITYTVSIRIGSFRRECIWLASEQPSLKASKQEKPPHSFEPPGWRTCSLKRIPCLLCQQPRRGICPLYGGIGLVEDLKLKPVGLQLKEKIPRTCPLQRFLKQQLTLPQTDADCCVRLFLRWRRCIVEFEVADPTGTLHRTGHVSKVRWLIWFSFHAIHTCCRCWST
jgi:hypothetical protein